MGEGYVYLLIEREFIKTQESVYKIGQTAQNPPWRRFDQYPKNSRLIFLINVENSINVERTIKKQMMMTSEIKHRTDIGQEYFEGDIDVIKKIFLMNCCDLPSRLVTQKLTTEVSLNNQEANQQLTTEVSLNNREVDQQLRTEVNQKVTSNSNCSPENEVLISVITKLQNESPRVQNLSPKVSRINANLPQNKDGFIKNSNPKKPQLCPFCPKIYKNLNSLQSHVISCCQSSIRPTHICQYCNRNFSKKFNLDRHIELNRCKILKKLQITNSNLKEQIITPDLKEKISNSDLKKKIIMLEKRLDEKDKQVEELKETTTELKKEFI
jgi:hypothetical protein